LRPAINFEALGQALHRPEFGLAAPAVAQGLQPSHGLRAHPVDIGIVHELVHVGIAEQHGLDRHGGQFLVAGHLIDQAAQGKRVGVVDEIDEAFVTRIGQFVRNLHDASPIGDFTLDSTTCSAGASRALPALSPRKRF